MARIALRSLRPLRGRRCRQACAGIALSTHQPLRSTLALQLVRCRRGNIAQLDRVILDLL